MKTPIRFLACLAALGLLSLSASASRSINLGEPTRSTPYDGYMAPVKNVLKRIDGSESSMQKAQQLLVEGRRFRYSFTTPYTAASPQTTEATRSGDCKAKALWLCDRLNDPSVRFVIGKARRNSRISHAWVLWQHESRWFILDPTNNWEPIPADKVSSNEYIPTYSYSKRQEFFHGAA